MTLLGPMPAPVTIEVKKSARVLRVVFADGKDMTIGFDALRAASPAADGKPKTPPHNVMIEGIERVGNYAIKPRFSDGHESGIYGWELLYRLGGGE